MSQMWSSQNRAGERAPGGAVYGGETGGEKNSHSGKPSDSA